MVPPEPLKVEDVEAGEELNAEAAGPSTFQILFPIIMFAIILVGGILLFYLQYLRRVNSRIDVLEKRGEADSRLIQEAAKEACADTMERCKRCEEGYKRMMAYVRNMHMSSPAPSSSEQKAIHVAATEPEPVVSSPTGSLQAIPEEPEVEEEIGGVESKGDDEGENQAEDDVENDDGDDLAVERVEEKAGDDETEEEEEDGSEGTGNAEVEDEDEAISKDVEPEDDNEDKSDSEETEAEEEGPSPMRRSRRLRQKNT